MISIFNGRRRGLGGSTSEVYAQLSLDFRDVLHQFKGARLGVFLAIALHADGNGWAWPSYDTLASETGYSKKAIREALADLCEMTLNGHRVLLRYQPAAGGGKRFSSNRYLLFPSPYQVSKYDGAGVQHMGDTGSGFGSIPRGDKRLPRENGGSRGDKTLPRYGGDKTLPQTRTITRKKEKEPEPTAAALLWADVLQDTRAQMTAGTWSDWLEPTRALQLDGDTLTVDAGSELRRDWLDNRLRATVERSVAAMHGGPLAVEFLVGGADNGNGKQGGD